MTATATDFTSILATREAERADAPAVSFGGTTRTWAEFARRVRQNVAAQRAAGLVPGDRVAVLDLNHPSCLETTLACAQAGTANAVVNFRLAPPEIVYVINDSKARILFVGPEFAGAVAQVRDKLPAVEHVIAVGGADDAYEAWIGAHEPDQDAHPAGPEDCFVQLYTSGTTGFPKGAMLTHRGMLAHSENVMADFDVDGDSRVQVAMPLFHVGGTSYALLAVTAGAHIHLMRLPDPAAALEMVERDRITHTFYVPALMAADAPGARRARARPSPRSRPCPTVRPRCRCR
jgi:acyl-CoA synthetase (AMP-forming)/AMP-acid ligase II